MMLVVPFALLVVIICISSRLSLVIARISRSSTPLICIHVQVLVGLCVALGFPVYYAMHFARDKGWCEFDNQFEVCLCAARDVAHENHS
jgi:hypothetical protein